MITLVGPAKDWDESLHPRDEAGRFSVSDESAPQTSMGFSDPIKDMGLALRAITDHLGHDLTGNERQAVLDMIDLYRRNDMELTPERIVKSLQDVEKNDPSLMRPPSAQQQEAAQQAADEAETKKLENVEHTTNPAPDAMKEANTLAAMQVLAQQGEGLERGVMLDKDGNIIVDEAGHEPSEEDKKQHVLGYVEYTQKEMDDARGGVSLHSHPTDWGQSDQDIINAAFNQMQASIVVHDDHGWLVAPKYLDANGMPDWHLDDLKHAGPFAEEQAEWDMQRWAGRHEDIVAKETNPPSPDSPVQRKFADQFLKHLGELDYLTVRNVHVPAASARLTAAAPRAKKEAEPTVTVKRWAWTPDNFLARRIDLYRMMHEQLAARAAKDFDESKHPRDVHGRFTDIAGGELDVAPGRGGQLTKILEATGGFTYSPFLLGSPKEGEVLSIHPERSQTITGRKVTMDDLDAFTEKNADLLHDKESYLGGWKDKGRVILDVVDIVDTREEAARLGKQHDQEAFYELQTGTTVRLKEARVRGVAEERDAGAEAGLPRLAQWGEDGRQVAQKDARAILEDDKLWAELRDYAERAALPIFKELYLGGMEAALKLARRAGYREFDETKHPRGEAGRFVENGNAPSDPLDTTGLTLVTPIEPERAARGMERARAAPEENVSDTLPQGKGYYMPDGRFYAHDPSVETHQMLAADLGYKSDREAVNDGFVRTNYYVSPYRERELSVQARTGEGVRAAVEASHLPPNATVYWDINLGPSGKNTSEEIVSRRATKDTPGPELQNRLAQRAALDAARLVNDWWNRLEATTRFQLEQLLGTDTTEDGGVDLGAVIDGVTGLFGPARAERIAVTETTRAMGQAATATYQELGIDGWEWRTAEDPLVCPICDDMEANNPYSIDDPFEPAHVNCRCWPVPLVEGGKEFDEEKHPRDQAGRFAVVEGSEPFTDDAERKEGRAAAHEYYSHYEKPEGANYFIPNPYVSKYAPPDDTTAKWIPVEVPWVGKAAEDPDFQRGVLERTGQWDSPRFEGEHGEQQRQLEAIEQGLEYAQSMRDLWSANPEAPQMMAFEETVAEALDLGPTHDPLYNDERAPDYSPGNYEKMLAEIEAYKQDDGKADAALAKNIYNQTQESLKAAGVKEVTLYRGLSWERDPSDFTRDVDPYIRPGNTPAWAKDVEAGDRLHITSEGLNALSSWSGSSEKADGFGRNRQYGMVIEMRVPAEKIFSTPQTGFGSSRESEWVVLSHDNDTAKVIKAGPINTVNGTWETPEETRRREEASAKMHELHLARAAAAAKARKLVVLDDSANAHWLATGAMKEFDEAKHPRDTAGRFSETEGEAATATAVPWERNDHGALAAALKRSHPDNFKDEMPEAESFMLPTGDFYNVLVSSAPPEPGYQPEARNLYAGHDKLADDLGYTGYIKGEEKPLSGIPGATTSSDTYIGKEQEAIQDGLTRVETRHWTQAEIDDGFTPEINIETKNAADALRALKPYNMPEFIKNHTDIYIDLRDDAGKISGKPGSGSYTKLTSARDALEAAIAKGTKEAVPRFRVFKDFNPDQPRDEHGRWTSGGEAGGSVLTAREQANAIKYMDAQHITSRAVRARVQALLQHATPENIAKGKDWYPAARRYAEEQAQRFGVSTDTVAAVIAATSPQVHWAEVEPGQTGWAASNQDQAEHVLGILNGDYGKTVTISMDDAAALYAMDTSSESKERQKEALDLTNYHGIDQTKWGQDFTGTHDVKDLPSDVLAAVHPEVDGLRESMTKAFEVARGKDIDQTLSGLKVRAFYNNIMHPESTDVTIDGHEIHALFANNDLPDKTYAMAINTPGKYEWFEDQVRAEAAQHGLTPSQLQAITWLQWRDDHPFTERRAASAKDLALDEADANDPDLWPTDKFENLVAQDNAIRRRIAAKEWDESKHPRDHGKFTFADSAGGGAPDLMGGIRAVGVPGPTAEHIKNVEALFEHSVKELNIMAGPDGKQVRPEEVKASLVATAQDIITHSDVAVRIPAGLVDEVLEQGLMNQHATNSTGGLLNPEFRTNVENEAFGIPKDAKYAEFPVYGYLSNPTSERQSNVSGYGDVRLVLKDEVKDRTTYTHGDSLGAIAEDTVQPAPLRHPDALAERQDLIQYSFKPGTPRTWDDPQNYTGNYWETQIHGGVRGEDIARIEYVLNPIEYADANHSIARLNDFDQQAKMAESRGIPVYVQLNPGDMERYTSERMQHYEDVVRRELSKDPTR